MRRQQFVNDLGLPVRGLLVLVSCSSSPSPSAPTPIAVPADAAADASPPADAPDPELAAAPAFVFRFHATGKAQAQPRLETWTLRALADRGMVQVQRMTPAANDSWAPGTQTRYLGTAADDGTTLTLTLAAGTDKLSLTCTRDKLDVAAATAVRRPSAKQPKGCDPGVWSPAKMQPLAVLTCKDPRYDAPMIFGAAPGLEYLDVNDGCPRGGYRQIAADGAIAPVR